MFKDRKEKEKGEAVTCSASEILGSFALLQEFLMLRVWATLNPTLKAACASFFALCFVLVMMLSVPRGGVTATMLLAAILKHLKLHGVAYGRDHWKPKFHYALHIAQQLADLGLEGALGVLDLGGGLVRALPRDEVALPLVEKHVAVVEDLARLPRAVRPRHDARERDDVAVQQIRRRRGHRGDRGW